MTSVSNFMMSFVRCPIRVTRRSNEPKVDSFASRAASSAWLMRRSRSAKRCADCSLELIEFRVREGNDHFAVRGERTSQRPDRSADLDEPVQVVRGHFWRIGHDPRVEILQLPLDVIHGAKVAGDDPVENRCDERGCIKRADLTSPLGALEELLEHIGPLR